MTHDLEPFIVRVEVRGPRGRVLPVLYEFRGAIEHWNRQYTEDSAGDVVGSVEILIHAAHDDDDARALVRDVIRQIPGAPEVLNVQ